MRDLKKRTGASLGVMAAVALIAVGAPASAENLRVMFQGDPYEIDAVSAVAKKFEAANPGTTVELIHTPHDSYNEKVGAAVSANQLPDILQLDAPFLSNYVWSGFLQPIDGLIDKSLLDDMTPSNISQGTYPPDGKLYATALIDSTVVLYASKKQLEALNIRIPTSVEDAWTGEEFEQILTTLSTAEGVKWPIDLFRGYGTKTEWIPYGYEPMMISAGCDLIDRATWKASGTLDNQACVDLTTKMADWSEKGWVVPQSAGTNQFYAEGRPAALAWGGFWFYAEAVKVMGDDLIALPLPKFGDKGASPNGTWIYAISESSENPELAGKFLSFMIQDAEYQAAYREHSAFPGLKSFAGASPLYAPGGPLAVAFEQAEKTAVPRPPHPAYPAITLAAQKALTNILDGSDPQEELSQAAADIDEDIEDNDGYPPFGEE